MRHDEKAIIPAEQVLRYLLYKLSHQSGLFFTRTAMHHTMFGNRRYTVVSNVRACLAKSCSQPHRYCVYCTVCLKAPRTRSLLPSSWLTLTVPLAIHHSHSHSHSTRNSISVICLESYQLINSLFTRSVMVSAVHTMSKVSLPPWMAGIIFKLG